MFPEVNETYFDEDIERQVKRMQTVIELTRVLRERHSLSLKVSNYNICNLYNQTETITQTPLLELLVFHPDSEWLEDVRPLEGYIKSELNIQNVVFSFDESLSGVKYRAVADWPVLGRKLRKDIGRVKNALPNVSSEDVKSYIKTGKLVVNGIELVEGDLTVQRYLDLPESATEKYATNTDNDVVVRLDIQVHPGLMGQWLAREMINRVQKLRKKAGLQATDDVDVFHKFEDGEGDDLLVAMEEHKEIINKTIRSVPQDAGQRKPHQKVLIEEEQEVAETKFVLSLAHP